MATTLRLMRVGRRSEPSYRIVAIDKRKKRSGAYLEKIGFYNPLTSPPVVDIDKEKFKRWLQKGATISLGLNKLLKNKKIKKDLSSLDN